MRWLPAGAMMLVSVISYVDRNTLALLAPTILEETHLSATEYGLVVSAYSIAFMLGNPLWGSWLDRIGVRRGMNLAVTLWTLASVAHAWATGFWSFAAARGTLGFGEGASAPGGLRTVTQTLPKESRSRGIALTYSGGSAGAIITPIVITPVAALWGWRAAFWLTGLIGTVWLLMWALVAPGGAAGGEQARDGARPSFQDPRLWAFLLAYSLGALPLGFVVYSAALYLSRALGMSQVAIGGLLWIPPLGSEIGIFFWGWLADRMSRGRSKLDAVARLLPLATALSLPLALVPRAPWPALVLAQFFFAMFIASAFQLLVITYGSEVFSKKYAGFIGGVGSGAYGAGLALVMPLFGKLYDLAQYSWAFALAALCPLLGYASWRKLSHTG